MNYKIKVFDKIIGTIKASGSKNAALPIIAAAILTTEEVKLTNVPLIDDVVDMIEILNELNVVTNYDYITKTLTINPKKISKTINLKTKSKIRASYYVLASLIHRKKKFKFSYPGGCNFTKRPIDIHLSLLKEFGVTVLEKDSLEIEVNKLKPINIIFPNISVGATINAIILAVLIKGKTTVKNIAIEPEVINVINFLISMGAKIKFIELRVLEIEGVKKLHGTIFEIMPDRIEIGSYALLALTIPKSVIKITNVIKNDIENVLQVIHQMNAKYELQDDVLVVYAPEKLKSINIKTGPYPLFPTDLQPIISALCLKADTESTIKETIYIDRDSHIKELQKASGNIKMEEGVIKVFPSTLKANTFDTHDLRCGFALIVAAVQTKEECIIKNVTNITRGYEDIEQKLTNLGIECIKQI